MMVSALRKLSFRQKDDLDRAKHYAMDQSIQYVMKQKQVTHQQNVSDYWSMILNSSICILATKSVYDVSGVVLNGQIICRFLQF